MMNDDLASDSSSWTEKRKTARKRWQILAQVLKGGSCAEVADSAVSVRRFQSFGLLSTKAVTDTVDLGYVTKEQDSDWFLYTCLDIPGFSMCIRHLRATISAERLNGFNNTGNVCVWPSEEVLTFYCMQHVQEFKGKRICELGGGMTCLAGVALGIYADAAHVELTDGNEESVQNLQCIIKNNSFGDTAVGARLLRWGTGKVDEDLQGAFDTVICADCLFFDDGREDLAQLIYDLLKPGGQALLFAPSRNKTFHKFLDITRKMFQASSDESYDSRVWEMHCKMLKENPETYDESLHFPHMMILMKPSSASSRDVTPESR